MLIPLTKENAKIGQVLIVRPEELWTDYYDHAENYNRRYRNVTFIILQTISIGFIVRRNPPGEPPYDDDLNEKFFRWEGEYGPRGEGLRGFYVKTSSPDQQLNEYIKAGGFNVS